MSRSWSQSPPGLSLMLALLALGCHHHEEGGGHGHSHGAHGHGEHGHDDHHGDEGPSIAVTRWTKTHELFVELGVPEAGKPVKYAAHVTRIADNHAVKAGALEVSWERDDEAVTSFIALKVARPGIFAFEAPAPAEPGAYTLRMLYHHEDEEAEWTAGPYTVGKEAKPPPEGPEGEVSFLKEAQWRIPFATEAASKRPIAHSLRLLAHVEPSPGQIQAVAAPVAGRLAWRAGAPLTPGVQVKAGEVVGRLFPRGADAHVSTLRLRLREGEVERDRARTEVRRLEGLVKDGLVPTRALTEARATFARAKARLSAARSQRDQSRGAQVEAIAVRAAIGGTIVQHSVADGDAVESGQSLLRLATTGQPQLHAEVLPAELPSTAALRAAWVEPEGREPQPVNIEGLASRRLVVDTHSGLAPLVFPAPAGDWPLGGTVPLRLAVGEAGERVTVPRGAVVEINTQPHVFVMVGGESFSRRRVTLGEGDATHVAVTEGLKAGERVVTVGGFDVYVASLAGTLESHRH